MDAPPGHASVIRRDAWTVMLGARDDVEEMAEKILDLVDTGDRSHVAAVMSCLAGMAIQGVRLWAFLNNTSDMEALATLMERQPKHLVPTMNPPVDCVLQMQPYRAVMLAQMLSHVPDRTMAEEMLYQEVALSVASWMNLERAKKIADQLPA